MTNPPQPPTTHHDPSGMWHHIATFGEHLIAEWHRTTDLHLPTRRPPAQLLIAATGGSAAAGDIVAALAAPISQIPILVVRGRQLPNFVDQHTLVIVVSCSGNTAETLALYDDAWRRDAPIIAITRGGHLAQRCTEDNVPIWTFTTQAPPRAAIAHTLAPLLRILERLGLYLITTPTIEAAGRRCTILAQQSATPGSPLARIATALPGHIPLILAGGHLAPLAERARNQLAENAKLLAAAATVPEAAHNLVVGLHPDNPPTPWLLLTLTAQNDPHHPYLQAIQTLATQRHIPVHPLTIPGDTPFEQALAALTTVDALSWHTAIARHIDPTPIPEIETIRQTIGQLPSTPIST
ncbi:SIS domain-containing protein [Tepidiforma sp.]|uniref:SIS domain-containing protein n=1 Tax=Tepidiforma sp. TaxID=2682230 RepID=UPI002ADD3B70|nr:SIS domain-containing protein [Tepidiforma sp.]